MAIKVKEGERLDDDHVEKVIALLEEGGTKKDAYDILNIKANPTRLNKIIEEYHSKKAIKQRLRKEKRGSPVTNGEIQTIVSGSLDGDSLESIAESIFRPVSFVKNVIESVGVPRKLPGEYWDRRYKTSIPDKCIDTKFEKYQIVWSNKYNGLALTLDTDEKGIVHIYVIEKITVEPEFAIGGKVYQGYGGFHAYQRPEELGNLKHLSDYGIDLYKPYRNSFPNWLKGV